MAMYEGIKERVEGYFLRALSAPLVTPTTPTRITADILDEFTKEVTPQDNALAHYIDLVVNHADAAPANLDALYKKASENNDWSGLPAPCGFKSPPPPETQLQLAILDGQDGAETILKHIVLKSPERKMKFAPFKELAYGAPRRLVFVHPKIGAKVWQCVFEAFGGKQFRQFFLSPEAKAKATQNAFYEKSDDEINAGFDYIINEAPKSTVGLQQARWQTIAMRAGVPLHGWPIGLVEKSLRSLAAEGALAKKEFSNIVTLCDEHFNLLVLNAMADLISSNHSLVLVGEPSVGKTPLGRAFLMAMCRSLRAIAIFLHYGVAARPSGCAECGGPTKFEARADREWNTYRWSCKTVGHKHFCEPVNSRGFLTKVPVNSWMPFLYLINNLRLGRNLKDAQDEMADLFGNIHRGTISVWKQLYQECPGKALPALDALMVGGKKGDTVVVDETVIGVDKADGWVLESRSVNKGGATTARAGPRRTTKLVRKQILKRLPARTVYNTQQLKSKPMKGPMKGPMKRPMKKPMKRAPPRKNVAIRKRPAANLKSNGRWLWIAVLVGNKSDVYTRQDLRKRVTHKLLPRKADAPSASARSALGKLGFESPPAVVHEGNQYRDKKTGFHTNDVESENARAKGWSRKRCGHLHLSEAEMDEYVFYVNVGGAMASVMRGLAASNDFVARNAAI
ncbi:unnamed protein product [Prorocentrum cordatum]|uniref:Uncharacterized protein n=1 Tax=Prorocentrum cordatum TaxID=2364126 RepID=A0ABN9PML8_9DINO|nr:unnamed protein product [Polarella glacialis]